MRVCRRFALSLTDLRALPRVELPLSWNYSVAAKQEAHRISTTTNSTARDSPSNNINQNQHSDDTPTDITWNQAIISYVMWYLTDDVDRIIRNARIRFVHGSEVQGIQHVRSQGYACIYL